MYQKKSWTSHEDEIIKRLVKQMVDRPQWKRIAQKINQLSGNRDPSNRRTPKQCRQRWHNKLDPHILDKQWDQDQINKLFQLHNEHGNKWSLIATMMNGRTDNCVKNKFYSALRKGMRKINKFIVNLKRKLASNKNICIKEFKDVVLTKLIAVADKKYEDKLDVRENSKSKTQNLSQAIKMALVMVSKNQDDYYGHVKNGVADDDYEVQEHLFKNIQEFCRNCKRKKGKKRDSELDEVVSEMVDQSQIIEQAQLKVEEKKQIKVVSPIVPVTKSKTKIQQKNIYQEEKINSIQNNSTFSDLNEGQNNSLIGSLQLDLFPNFIKVTHEQPQQNFNPLINSRLTNKISTQQNHLFDKIGSVAECQFFKTIPIVIESNVEYEKTDCNNKQLNALSIQEMIFKSQPSTCQAFNNNSNPFSLEKSGPFLGFLGRNRSHQNPFDINQHAIQSSLSYSSSQKQLQQRTMEIMQIIEKGQNNQENRNLQRSTQNIQINQIYQLDQILRRNSERK